MQRSMQIAKVLGESLAKKSNHIVGLGHGIGGRFEKELVIYDFQEMRMTTQLELCLRTIKGIAIWKTLLA